MESIGHYHKILFQSFYNTGFEVAVFNPIQTDCVKNLGIRKVKNDKGSRQPFVGKMLPHI
jgi:transposase